METKMRPVDIRRKTACFICYVHDIPETIIVNAKVFDWNVVHMCVLCSKRFDEGWQISQSFLMFA